MDHFDQAIAKLGNRCIKEGCINSEIIITR
jgi:hypothetical protein